MDYLNANTVEVPIYWDEFEPQPGQYDYTSIDRLLKEARQHNVRLVPLWFATWKNGSQHYMPEWMLQAPTVISMRSIGRGGGGLAVAVRHRLARGGQAGVRRLHATPQGGRPTAHRDHGPGGE